MPRTKQELPRRTERYLRRVGKQLRELREGAGMSVSELALAVGIDTSTQWRREEGQPFQVSDIEQYAFALKCDPAILLPSIGK
jgi:transcriptional regulator with XRE-family HTH domain